MTSRKLLSTLGAQLSTAAIVIVYLLAGVWRSGALPAESVQIILAGFALIGGVTGVQVYQQASIDKIANGRGHDALSAPEALDSPAAGHYPLALTATEMPAAAPAP